MDIQEGVALMRRKGPDAIMRPLPASDPRSLDHPCHKEQWMEFYRARGRAMARYDWERLHGGGNDGTTEGGTVRQILERHSKGHKHRGPVRGGRKPRKTREPESRS